jgi:hypothetical protein
MSAPVAKITFARQQRFVSGTTMDHPETRSVVEIVRKINEIGRRARSGKPGVEEYLRDISSDPLTEWYTGLLQEKSAELENERSRADRLFGALRAWHGAKEAESAGGVSQADAQLIHVLRTMGFLGA